MIVIIEHACACLERRGTIYPHIHIARQGVFTKELDIALADGSIDLAVHCVKDLPTILPDGLMIGPILTRGDTQDAVVMHAKHKGKTLADLPKDSVIGTAALRRKAVLGRKFPSLTFKNIRGNVNTRLAKLDRGEYDAIILARIGLMRLGFEERISEVLEEKTYSYAVGQGALAVMHRESDKEMNEVLMPLAHPPTQWACEAERGMLRTLQGGCKVPIAVLTQLEEKEVGNSGVEYTISIKGQVYSVDGKECIEDTKETTFSPTDASKHPDVICRELGDSLGQTLLASGAAPILKAIHAYNAENTK